MESIHIAEYLGVKKVLRLERELGRPWLLSIKLAWVGLRSEYRSRKVWKGLKCRRLDHPVGVCLLYVHLNIILLFESL